MKSIPSAWSFRARTVPTFRSNNTAQRLYPTRKSQVGQRWITSSSSPSHVGSSPKTIPGPTWLWLEPVYEPFRAYGRIQQRRPYVTQFVSALVIYFVGDIVAQSIGPVGGGDVENREVEGTEGEQRERGWLQAWGEDRDWARTARALCIGGAAAVPGYRWFLWLGNSFNYGSKAVSLTAKVRIRFSGCSLSRILSQLSGYRQPTPLHPALQLLLLRHALVTVGRLILRNRNSNTKHGPHELDQQL
jgi:protein Mpv17